MIMFEPWLTSREAAGILEVTEPTLEKLVQRGRLSVQRTPAGDRYSDREVCALARERKRKRKEGQ